MVAAAEAFWADLLLGVSSGAWEAADVKVGLGTLGLVHEVLQPGNRAPPPIDRMVEDVLAAILEVEPAIDPVQTALATERVAAFVRATFATNPVLVQFGSYVARAWADVEDARLASARSALGTAQHGAPSSPPDPRASALAVRLAQLRSTDD